MSENIKLFNEIKAELVAQGFFKKRKYLATCDIFCAFMLFLISLYAAIYNYFLSAILIGFSFGLLGWLQHHAGHMSLYEKKWQNIFAQIFCHNILSGFSANAWRATHHRHHGFSNTRWLDPDLVLLKNIRQKGWYTLFHLTLYPWKQLFATCIYLKYKKLYVEMLLILSHWIGVFMFLYFFTQFSMMNIILWYLISRTIYSFYMVPIFTMNHTAAPYVPENYNWENRAFRTSNNLKKYPFVDYFTGFLSCQIEHHLFPNMPPYNYRKIKAQVLQLGEEIGEKYIELSFLEMFKQTFFYGYSGKER